MKLDNLLRALYVCASVCILALLGACANMAQGPTGGLRDSLPPVYKTSKPLPNSLNFRENKVEIEFDEYVQLKDGFEKIVVSPPTKSPFVAKALGKKVVVEFRDTLKPNTTYTIDFSNSIVDNNESNPFNEYFFSFSTGDVLDTLSMSGYLLNAKDLSPAAGVYVGAYKQHDDSVFVTKAFDRIAKTEENGRFTLRNLEPVPYRVFALNDVNSNYYFDQPGEAVAFLDSVFTPKMIEKVRFDTIYKDSVTIDTVKRFRSVRYLPDSVTLQLFEEEIVRQSFKKAELTSETTVELYFENYEKQVPEINPVNFVSDNWAVVEPSVTTDTIKVWLRDSNVVKLDTLRFELVYQKTDSASNFVEARDTIQLFQNRKKAKRRDDKKQTFLTCSSGRSVEVYNLPRIEWSAPVDFVQDSVVKVEMQKDTLWEKVDFRLVADSAVNARSYLLEAEWKEGSSYRLRIDSASVTDIYGNCNDKTELKFRIKTKEEYSTLKFKVQGVADSAFVELLNAKEQVKRVENLRNGEVFFKNVHPGEYYARLVVDSDNDGLWTTGKYIENRKPEQVYYFSKTLKLRANWDVEEVWNVTEKNILNQRPSGLNAKKKKNKR